MTNGRRRSRTADIEAVAKRVDEIGAQLEREERPYRALYWTWSGLLLLGVALTFAAFIVNGWLGAEASTWVDALTVSLGGAFVLSGATLTLLSRYSPPGMGRAIVLGCGVLSMLVGALPIGLVIV